MRDKIVFFVLGAVLSIIAYTIGDLETLTAEDQITELDHLNVNRITVKDGIVVGDIGKKSIMIMATNESALITLFGGEMPKNRDSVNNNIGNAPAIELNVKDNGALIKVVSHSQRPESSSVMTVAKIEGKKFESGLILKDSNGTKVILSNSTD